MTDKYGKIHTDGSRSGGQPLDDSIEPKEVFRQKAIDLINEYRQVRGDRLIDFLPINTPETSAFIRSIQLHEKTKQEFADFKQEVSDVVEIWRDSTESDSLEVIDLAEQDLLGFIIPKLKPDPLVEVLDKMLRRRFIEPAEEVITDEAAWLRAALDALGFEIREKGQ
jgi:hypothetical protein